MNVVITGAAGRIAYSLIPLILNGDVFGAHQRISLRLLDIPIAEQTMHGLKLEIEDCCYELLDSIVVTVHPDEAFRDANVAILLGGFPRSPGMERRDLIAKNAIGMHSQATALENYADKDCKVLIVANPANTNCFVAIKSAPSIPAENFSCLSRLDHERLRAQITCECQQLLRSNEAEKISPSQVRNVAVFGNHSKTQVPYFDDARVLIPGRGEIKVRDWFDPNALSRISAIVQNRGTEIIQHMKASSAVSAANSIKKHLQDWLGIGAHSTLEEKDYFSMGIWSHGNPYGVPGDIVFSFPCRRDEDGRIQIVGDLPISESTRVALNYTVEELLDEKSEALEALGDKILA